MEISKGALWGGRIMGGLSGVFLALDAVLKLVQPAALVEATAKSGWPVSSLTGLGAVLLLSSLLYLFPKTAVLGAILLTGYLGGAVAAHVRAGDGWLQILFPAFFGALVWGGLWLRDPRIRALIPIEK